LNGFCAARTAPRGSAFEGACARPAPDRSTEGVVATVVTGGVGLGNARGANPVITQRLIGPDGARMGRANADIGLGVVSRG
jgi:hypothetical protein